MSESEYRGYDHQVDILFGREKYNQALELLSKMKSRFPDDLDEKIRDAMEFLLS